jgi:hypothetical protein
MGLASHSLRLLARIMSRHSYATHPSPTPGLRPMICSCRGTQVLTVADVQREAAERIREAGATNVNEATRGLASIGASGRSIGNAERDLRRLLARECDLPLACTSTYLSSACKVC